MDLVDENMAVEEIEPLIEVDPVIRVAFGEDAYKSGRNLPRLGDREVSYWFRLQLLKDVFSAMRQAGYEVVKR
jgi:hypothetical protein